MCPECDVSLVLHMREGAIACHHCGHREPVPARCGSCGSAALARHGAGTERLEDELRAALGDGRFPVFRLDADVAAAKDRAAATLERFERADAGILIGTQMVAKGHDFPDVTLGVVLDADQTLRFPDFRAEERTFSLVTQLAGRAGRGERGGRVLVQTLAPAARPIVLRVASRLGRIPRGGARPPPGALLPAVRLADPDRMLAPSQSGTRTRSQRSCGTRSRGRERRSSARRRCSGCAARPDPSSF